MWRSMSCYQASPLRVYNQIIASPHPASALPHHNCSFLSLLRSQQYSNASRFLLLFSPNYRINSALVSYFSVAWPSDRQQQQQQHWRLPLNNGHPPIHWTTAMVNFLMNSLSWLQSQRYSSTCSVQLCWLFCTHTHKRAPYTINLARTDTLLLAHYGALVSSSPNY